MSTFTNVRATAVLASTVALLLAAFAAAPQAEASTLYACVKTKSGTARVFTKKPKCKKHESKISWNTEGPAGKNGTSGTSGTNGTNGVNGAVAGYYATTGSSGVAFTDLEAKENDVTILSMKLPAGSYIVSGKVDVLADQSGTNGEGEGPLTTYVDVGCTLTVGGVSDISDWSGVTNIPVIFFATASDTLPFDLGVTTTSPTTATITCTNFDNDGSKSGSSSFGEEASFASITAVQTTANS